jgi:hypothetical protein
MDKYLLNKAKALAGLIADLGPHHAQDNVLRLRGFSRLCLLRLCSHVGLLDLLLF